jgi:hypothetical protein
VRLLVISLLALGCSGALGCGGALGQSRRESGRVGLAPDSPRCRDLDDRQALWSGVAQGAGALAGGSGLSTVATDDDRARLALGVGAAVAGATAALAVAIADGSTQSWARECSAP